MEENLQNQETAPIQPQSLKVYRKSWIKIILLVFIGLILLGGAFYAGIKFSEKRKNQASINLPNPSITTIPSPVTTSAPASDSSELKTEERIVFVRDGDIYVINPDGRDEKRLTTYGANWKPVFSPNGQWIAYSSLPKELKGQGVAPAPSNIWLIKPDGSDARKLSKKSRVIDNIIWSPDSKNIAFSATNSEVVIINVENGEEQILVKDAGPSGITPANPIWLTPNTLVYLKKIPESPQEVGVAMFIIDEKRSEWLTKEVYFSNLLFLTRENKILAQYKNEKTFWQIDILTKEVKKLDKLNWNIAQDIWLADGWKLSPRGDKLIAPVSFQSKLPSESESEIVFLVMDINTGKTDLVNSGLNFEDGLDWCLNGNWLVFNGVMLSEKIAKEREITNYNLWRVNLQNKTKEKLTNNARSCDCHLKLK